MIIADFRASADLVGRRVWLSWTFVPERSETLADIPQVSLRRKTRDFEFPPPNGTDPYLVYSSQSFPSQDLTVTDLPGWRTLDDGGGHTESDVISVARSVGGTTAEVLRVITSTSFDAARAPRSRAISILDTGDSIGGLLSGTPYYYELFSPAIPPDADPGAFRSTATPGERHGLNRTLYELLPEIYRRHDVIARPPDPGSASVPEMASRSGQLRRFVDLFGTALDLVRSNAEGLLDLHNVDNLDYRYLSLLSGWIGWELSFDLPIPVWRNEIKSAPRLYGGIGTVPSIRALINQYSGWSTKVTEYAQHIVRSNVPSQQTIFGMTETSSGWLGIDDASLVLGFGSGNTDTGAASLTGSTTAPFALHPGSELSVSVDGNDTQTLRFGSTDFHNIHQATAPEVAVAINAGLDGLEANAVGSSIQLRSNSVGAQSALRITPSSASLVTLEGAPSGRLSTLVDAAGRVRLFYTVRPQPTDTQPVPTPTIHYKTYVAGAWTNSRVLVGPSASHAAPAAFSLPDGRLGLVFIEDPDTPHARLRMMFGVARDPLPARLAGQRGAPFNLGRAARLALRGDWGATETVTFRATDFADPTHATAVEIVAAVNSRAKNFTASVQSNGSLLLQSRRLGPDALLELDASQSSGIQSLGFDARTSSSGTWDDTITWQPPQDVPGVAPARHADPHALVDASGTLWIFWATHANALWSVVNIRWNGSTWSAVETRAQGQGGNREPCAVLDQSNRIWLLWSRRQGVATPEDIWTLRRMMFDPATTTWSAEDALTSPPAPRASDREPAAVREADGRVRVFFSSDRSGSRSLWSVTFTPGGSLLAPVGPLAPSPATDAAPAPVRMTDGSLWLLVRSDRNITLSHAARTAAGYSSSSSRVPEAATLHRLVGTTTVVPTDLQRLQHRLQWDDLLAYTVQKPDGSSLLDADRFTRGTIGLFVSSTANGRPLTEVNVVRVRQLLDRFLPINARSVIVFEPTLSVEEVYQVGADIQDTYSDAVPSPTFLG